MPRVVYYSYLLTVGQMGEWGMGDNSHGKSWSARLSCYLVHPARSTLKARACATPVPL